MLTANCALDYGREVMAVPGDVHRWASQGPNEFIRQGATLVRNAAHVLLALGWSTLPENAPREAAAAGEAAELRPLGDAGRRIVLHLQSAGPLSIDEIAEQLAMTVDDVAATVTWMETWAVCGVNRAGALRRFVDVAEGLGRLGFTRPSRATIMRRECQQGGVPVGTLVIVESPAKARTISKFLGRGYTVKASVGHVRDLPKSQFGVDVENNFEPRDITIRGKREKR